MPEQLRHLVAGACEDHATLDTERAHVGADLRLPVAIADQKQACRWVLPEYLGCRLDDQRVILARVEAADVTDDERIGGQSERPSYALAVAPLGEP